MYLRARHGGMGYLPQQSSIFARLTVQQNLLAMMELLKMDRKTRRERCNQLLKQFEIERLRKSRAGRLSGGERRRLEIARCLVSNPEIIMLDEPFAGIDPVTVQNIQEVIRDLKQSGLSILITDHAAREILQITDRTYVVSEGKILCSGSAEEIVQNPEVKRKYLGEIDFVKRDRPEAEPPVTPLPQASDLPVPDATPIRPSVLDQPAGRAAGFDLADPASARPGGTQAPQAPQAPGLHAPVRRPTISRSSTFEGIEAPFSSKSLE
jgi:lipopolysaccharide export system ATP-binding protein